MHKNISYENYVIFVDEVEQGVFNFRLVNTVTNKSRNIEHWQSLKLTWKHGIPMYKTIYWNNLSNKNKK